MLWHHVMIRTTIEAEPLCEDLVRTELKERWLSCEAVSDWVSGKETQADSTAQLLFDFHAKPQARARAKSGDQGSNSECSSGGAAKLVAKTPAGKKPSGKKPSGKKPAREPTVSLRLESSAIEIGKLKCFAQEKVAEWCSAGNITIMAAHPDLKGEVGIVHATDNEGFHTDLAVHLTSKHCLWPPNSGVFEDVEPTDLLGLVATEKSAIQSFSSLEKFEEFSELHCDDLPSPPLPTTTGKGHKKNHNHPEPKDDNPPAPQLDWNLKVEALKTQLIKAEDEDALWS